MFTANNQVIIEDLYDENIQPTEEDVVEYAQFIGIDVNEVINAAKWNKIFYCFLTRLNVIRLQEQELMWIARQGVMAPLPKGWKAVQDPQGELYYFNFETGESIWDHPCDEDFKNLVISER